MYLDFARFGPPWPAVVAAQASLTALTASAGPSTVDELMRADDRARAAVGRLCGTDADHVVLVPNTSTGLFQVAFAVDGDVLASTGEFPANAYPWARAGRARWMPDAPVTPSMVRAVTDTAAVAVSAVNGRTGYRADLAALRDAVGDRLLVVDGIQGFGVVGEPWQAADVLVVGGQKWLRAGWSTGFMVFSDRALDRLAPVLSGWTGVVEPSAFDGTIQPPAPGAAAWSLTNLSPISASLLAVALEIVENTGVHIMESEIAARVEALADVVHRTGGHVVSSYDPSRPTGILAFTLPGVAAHDIAAALRADGIAVTARDEHVRLSPHVSTTDDTVEAVADVLKRLR